MNYSYDRLSSTIFNVFLNSSRQGERVNLGVRYLDDTLSISVYGFSDDVPDEALDTRDSTLQAVQIFELNLKQGMVSI